MPVERVFGTLKRNHGFFRARYVGLERNANPALLLVIAFNMRKAVRLAAGYCRWSNRRVEWYSKRSVSTVVFVSAIRQASWQG